MNKLSLISESVADIQIKNQPGINQTNTTYTCPQTCHVWQPCAMILYGRSESHLSLVHVFHVIPHSGLSVGGSYTISVLISRGIVGYHPITTIIELRSYKSSMQSVKYQMLAQGSNTNGHQSTQAGATTLEPRISTFLSLTLPSCDTPLSPSCPARSQI
jgi:hypothetical protein